MHWPYDVPAQSVAATARTCSITLLGINTAPGRFERGERGLGAVPGRERDFQHTFDQAIEYCRISGARSIHAMAGNVPAAQRVEGRRVFLENLRTAVPKAARQGLTVLLEALNPADNPGYFYSSVEDAAHLIEELGVPNLKLQFDIYHVARAEGDVMTRLNRLWKYVGHVQIAAVPTRAEPDEGEICYPAIFSALADLGYDGWIGCEYRPRGDTDAGLSWMRALNVQGIRPAATRARGEIR